MRCGIRYVRYGLILACLGLLTGCYSTKEWVVLLPGEDGQVGAVAVKGKEHTEILDAPLTSAVIDTRGQVKRRAVDETQVQETFGRALAAQPPQSISFTLYFVHDSTETVPASQPTLEALFTEVARRLAVEVQITGHTDRVGTVAYNDRLSLNRAEAVRDMLIQRGLRASFIRAVGRGEREPLIPTPDEQPEPRNRRVEIIVR
jgi:outer membrane protein OmpA-like peptidoglycan-associated protein